MATLNGLFDEPKPHRINFIKENKKLVRRSSSANSVTNGLKVGKTHSAHGLRTQQNENTNPNVKTLRSAGTECKIINKGEMAVFLQDKNEISEKITHTPPSRGQGNIPKVLKNQFSQTIDPKKFDELYFDGKIRYPSAKTKEKIEQIQKEKQKRLDVFIKDDMLQTRLKEKAKLSNIILPKKKVSAKEERKREDTKKVSEKIEKPCNMNAAEFLLQTEEKLNNPLQTKRSISSDNCSNVRNSVPANYVRGVVPKYLRDKQEKQRQDEEKKKKELVDPHCPPGHVALPDTERQNTLEMLKIAYAEAVQELNLLPVRSDTLRVRQKKIELDKKLNKLEEGIKVFNKAKVYVKID